MCVKFLELIDLSPLSREFNQNKNLVWAALNSFLFIFYPYLVYLFSESKDKHENLSWNSRTKQVIETTSQHPRDLSRKRGYTILITIPRRLLHNLPCFLESLLIVKSSCMFF